MSDDSGRHPGQLSIIIPPPDTLVTPASQVPSEGEIAKETETPAQNAAKTPKNQSLAPVQPQAPPISALPTPPAVPSTPNTLYGPNSSSQSVSGPSVINKQLLSKLNKSLKEKQKVVNQKDTHKDTFTKNPALIQDILTTSPQLTGFANNIPGSIGNVGPSANTSSANITGEQPTGPVLEQEADHTENETVSNAASTLDVATKNKAKSKRIAKQNSTRTDFFAAKLASAVDDVETSDSDETFVYENNANDFEGSGNNANSSAPEDTRSVLGTENINNAPLLIHLVQDNISTTGSIKNAPVESAMNSPSTEPSRRERDEEHPRAESVHSVQSSKWNLRSLGPNTTPPTTTNGRAPAQYPVLLQQPNAESSSYTNPYMEHLLRESQYKARRKSSSHSLLNDDHRASALTRSPMLYSEPSQNPRGLIPSSYGISSLPNTHSIHGSNDGHYSFDEEDDELIDTSSQDDSNLLGDANANNTITESQIDTQKSDHCTEKTGKKSKISTTSSKLRSTTSKLFDKKGGQPRRYSIIPDDIDIEDFDDELIYYDNNNIRFPYNSQNGSQLTETASFLGNNHGNNHRIPHYKSLNNFSGKRQPSHMKNKRYLSLNYNGPTTPIRPSGNKSNNDIFPFPYPEPQNYYYDFDEYDEDAHIEDDELRAKGLFSKRAHLSPGNTHFFLPRKVSDDNLGSHKIRLLKSFVYTLVSILCILGIGFVLGFLLASTKDLSNISIVSIENALVSQDELVFSIVVEALNPGWFTVTVEDVELDIFAKSGYLNDENSGVSVETVLLGSVFAFESALNFDGSFFNRELIQQTGEIKLIGPGKNLTGSNDPRKTHSLHNLDEDGEPPDNYEKWGIISKHPFDLILRGVLKYNLPMTSNSKSAVVNKVAYIDPNVPNGSSEVLVDGVEPVPSPALARARL